MEGGEGTLEDSARSSRLLNAVLGMCGGREDVGFEARLGASE